MNVRVTQYPALHRYFIQAMVNRRAFLDELEAERGEQPKGWSHLLLWYGCLYVVVEGWRTERIDHAPVTSMLGDDAMLGVLRRCRNAVFHYSPTYTDPRVQALMNADGFVPWVHSLYDEISIYFLAGDDMP